MAKSPESNRAHHTDQHEMGSVFPVISCNFVVPILTNPRFFRPLPFSLRSPRLLRLNILCFIEVIL
jgi:hypothetical protein